MIKNRSEEELADLCTELVSDLFDDEVLEDMEEWPAEKRIRHAFLRGECDYFAVALHRMTGWPIRGVFSNDIGPLHRVVEAPDGRLLDASGWTSLEALRKRYKLKKRAVLTMSPPGDEEMAIGFTVECAGETDWTLELAVAAIRMLPGEPFSSSMFMNMSSRPVAGADHPSIPVDDGETPSP
jgi:hypothetical protein